MHNSSSIDTSKRKRAVLNQRLYQNTHTSWQRPFLLFFVFVAIYSLSRQINGLFSKESQLSKGKENAGSSELAFEEQMQIDYFYQSTSSLFLNVNALACHTLMSGLKLLSQKTRLSYGAIANLPCLLDLSYGQNQPPLCGENGEFNVNNLDSINGFQVDGANVGDNSGRSVSSAGDINGDGYDDLIIGSPGSDPDGLQWAGTSYVIYGSLSFVHIFSLSAIDGTNGFRIDGINSYDESGRSVSAAGDFNGDGYADLIIGASGVDDPDSGDYDVGAVYVVYGGPSIKHPLSLSELDGSNGLCLYGISPPRSPTGDSVSTAGDINGDGYADIIIGAYNREPGNLPAAGESYVVYGGSGIVHPFSLDTLNGINGFRIDGAAQDEFSGFSVSTAGDINSDGFADLIISADRASPNGLSQAGNSYVVYGGVGILHPLSLGTLNGINGFRIEGVNPGESSGRSVSAGRDVNGDGFDDVIIGAYLADYNGLSNSGASYVVYGGSSVTHPLILSTLDGSNGFRIDGINPSDQSGHSVSAAGDINGDGYADLIIGAPYANAITGIKQTGAAYVVYGGSSIIHPFALSTLDGSNGFGIVSSLYDLTDIRVSAAGDFNGDGFADIIVGNHRTSPNDLPHHLKQSGVSFVVFCASKYSNPVSMLSMQPSGTPSNYPTGQPSTEPTSGLNSAPSSHPTGQPTALSVEYKLAKEITSLYLSGLSGIQKPSCDGHLPMTPLYRVMDVQTFMSRGPGRFAVGAQFELIKKFFETSTSDIPVGNFTKSQLAAHFGLSYYGWIMNQYYFPDEERSFSEYVERVYVFNTQEYKISNNALFVVTDDGERRIENFSIEPSPENFDFSGGNLLTNFLNIYLENCVDPAEIGNPVGIIYDGNLQQSVYHEDDYHQDETQLIIWNLYFTLSLLSKKSEILSSFSSMLSILPNSRHCRDGGFGWGEPHLVSHDGLRYDFQAPGEFVLVGSSSDDLKVQVRQEFLDGSTSVSVNTAVAISANGTNIGLYIKHPMRNTSTFEKDVATWAGYLFVNHTEMEMGFNELQLFNGLLVQRQGKLYDVVTPSGDGFNAVVYKNHIDIAPLFSKSRVPGTVYGLLGNYDGSYTNDLSLSNGSELSMSVPASVLYGEYADSWRVTNASSLFVYENGQHTSSFIDDRFIKRYITVDDFSDDEVSFARSTASAAGYNEDDPIFKDIMLEVLVGGVNISELQLIPNNSTYSHELDVIKDTYKPSSAPTFQPANKDKGRDDFVSFISGNSLVAGLLALSAFLALCACFNRKKITGCFSGFFSVQIKPAQDLDVSAVSYEMVEVVEKNEHLKSANI